jgi:hypothetical protein
MRFRIRTGTLVSHFDEKCPSWPVDNYDEREMPVVWWGNLCASCSKLAGMEPGRVNFRIRKGTQVSHFHEKCMRWPTDSYYEQDKPLWWGNLCEECAKLADIDASVRKTSRVSG